MPEAKRVEQTIPQAAWSTGSAGAAAQAPAMSTPLAVLFSRHILRDGEVILLILKPSIFFIVLSMLRFAAFIFIVMIASVLFDDRLPGEPRTIIEVGAVLLAARLMWASMQWMGRLYILTDMRIVTLSGVLTLSIFDCPLRKVARTRLLYTMRERICRLGSLEIIPSDETYPIGIWQMIARPIAINDQIVAAINRARQGRNGG